MKRIMILGAGPNQIPLIRAAKKRGYYVIACDYNREAPGVELADELCLASIMDAEAVLAAAKALRLDGIISNSEPAMSVVAYVGNALGLPSNEYETVRALSDKALFRGLLASVDAVVPKYGEAKTCAEARTLAGQIGYPLVIKPGASSGSRGVAVLGGEAELERAFEYALHFSRNGKVMLEEYIENVCGSIVGGDIFVYAGKVVFWGLSSSYRAPEFPLVPAGEIFPPLACAKHIDVIKAEISRVAARLGIRFGAFNMEMMIDPQGRARFIEMNPRNGGNLIPEELLMATGFDIFDATVRAAVGEPVEAYECAGCCSAATYLTHTDKAGTLKSVSFSDEISRYIVDYIPDSKPGDAVEPFINAEKRIGTLFLRFDSAEQCRAVMDKIKDHVTVTVE